MSGASFTIMLSIDKISLKNINYYLELAREDYYLNGGEPPGQWHGKALRARLLIGFVVSLSCFVLPGR